VRKITWRSQCDFIDFEVVMRDGYQCDGYQQGKTSTQLNPELKKSDKRSAELDGPDVTQAKVLTRNNQR
jgi:hypothetical protein